MPIPGHSARQSEIKAVTDIITSDEYETPDKMARAILSQVYELFEERDWYMVAMRNDGANLVYGLYGTEGAAQKALEKNDLGLFGTCGIFPAHSAAKRREYIKEAMKSSTGQVLCTTCGHEAQCHSVRKADPSCFGCDKNCAGFIKPEKK